MIVNKYAKRLKYLVDNECEYLKRRNQLAKTSAKYKNKIYNLEMAIIKQQNQLKVTQAELHEKQFQNSLLKRKFEKEEIALLEAKKNVIRLKEDYEQMSSEQITKRSKAIEHQCKLRYLKGVTKTFIKADALPEIVQGVIVCERENSRQWKPFCIRSSEYTIEEAQDIIWSQSMSGSIYTEQWQTLIMSPYLDELGQKEIISIEEPMEVK